MNTLLSVRTNIVYVKKTKLGKNEKDEYLRHQELIFLVDKATYRHSNEGEIIRERGIDEFRFLVSEKSFDELIKILGKLKNVEETELS